jgi:hypothetical protein
MAVNLLQVPVYNSLYTTWAETIFQSSKETTSKYLDIKLQFMRSRNSVVGIATGYGLDDRGVGVRVPVGSRILFSTLSRPALRSTLRPIQWVPWALSQGLKRPGNEADHSPPAVPRSRKHGSIHPLPHMPLWRS